MGTLSYTDRRIRSGPRRRAGASAQPVDVLVVSSGTTPGLQRDFEELLAALRQAGCTFAVATSSYGLLGRLRPLALAINELVVAASMRHAVKQALRQWRPRAVIVTTSTAAGLLPNDLLRRSAIRFDGLAAGTRNRWQDAPSRLFERRCVHRAQLLAPYGERARSDLARVSGVRAPSIVWPSPIDLRPAPSSVRRPAALCYANDPEKKGLDIAVAAWDRAAPPTHRLLVTGIDEAAGRRFLQSRGISVPTNLDWLGRLGEAEYRDLSAAVLLYLGTSRVDQFARTQLEALADGALLVTVPSNGPLEALDLARELDPRLVAESISAEAVADSIRSALALTPDEQATYRDRARQLLSGYSRESVAEVLRSEILPRILPPVSS